MSAQKLMYKWWKDNDRYIQDPWAEISLLQQELKQMAITEAALRESLTGLSRESNEYRHKIETENAALRAEIKSVLDALNTAANAGGFDGYDGDTPLLVNLTSHWDRLYTIADKEIKKLEDEIVKANGLLDMRMKEIAKLKQTLIEVTTELTAIKCK